MRRLKIVSGVIVGGALLASCAPQPKYVAASTGSPGQIKFLYFKDGGEQGVIKCDRTEDGTLSNCRIMSIELKGE